MAGFNSSAGPSANVGAILPFLAIIEVSSTTGVLLPDVVGYGAYAFEEVVRGWFA